MLLDALPNTPFQLVYQRPEDNPPSPIASLPNELLAVVFEHSAIGTPYSWWLLQLTFVCRRWRGIINTTSGIWLLLSLTSDDTEEMCRWVLDRSPQTPIGVQMTLPHANSWHLDSRLFEDLVASRSQFWQTLLLYQWPSSPVIREALSHAVNLRKLEVINGGFWSDEVDPSGQNIVIDVPEEAPLREISLRGVMLRWSDYTPINLERLGLYGHANLPPCSRLLMILGSSPCLKYLHLGGNEAVNFQALYGNLGDLPISDGPNPHPSITILPELQLLHLCNLHTQYIVPLLSHLDTPAVTSLAIQGDVPEIFDPSHTPFRNLVARLMANVSELEVRYTKKRGDICVASFQLWDINDVRLQRHHECPHYLRRYCSRPGLHLSIGGITEANWENVSSTIREPEQCLSTAVALALHTYHREVSEQLSNLDPLSFLRGLPHTESLTIYAPVGDLITMFRGLAGHIGPHVVCPKLSKLDIVTRFSSLYRNNMVTERQGELCAAYDAFVISRQKAHQKDASVVKLCSMSVVPEVAFELRGRESFKGIEVGISSVYAHEALYRS